MAKMVENCTEIIHAQRVKRFLPDTLICQIIAVYEDELVVRKVKRSGLRLSNYEIQKIKDMVEEIRERSRQLGHRK